MTSMKVVNILLGVCVALASAGTRCTQEEMARENLQKLAMANNELAFNLHRMLVSGSSENVFFSPLSISSAFAMLYYGARGDTAQELRQALGYEKADIQEDVVHDSFKRFLSEVLKSGDSSDEYVLDVANAILADEHMGLLEDYKSEVEDFYKADVREVDFKTDAPKILQEINSWVNEKTHGKIEKLLDELSPSTLLSLLNAVYFKGTWETPFNASRTKDAVFYNNGQELEQKTVPFMHLTSRFPVGYFNNFKALELPYKGENVSMIILLPKERDGLQDLENSLTPEKLAEIQRQLHATKVQLSLPKFKLEFEQEISSLVKALGANQIFSAGSADFSGMTSSKNVFVSQIIHKAVIEVNEEGSEAAAVTGFSYRSGLFQFKADHPFLFTIVEKGSSSNMILFLGRVNKF